MLAGTVLRIFYVFWPMTTLSQKHSISYQKQDYKAIKPKFDVFEANWLRWNECFFVSFGQIIAVFVALNFLKSVTVEIRRHSTIKNLAIRGDLAISSQQGNPFFGEPSRLQIKNQAPLWFRFKRRLDPCCWLVWEGSFDGLSTGFLSERSFGPQ